MTKQTWGAFHGTPLDTCSERGVTQIVLTGVVEAGGIHRPAATSTATTWSWPPTR